ncbi:MAG TPA: TetR/AcrR family transcriptional regulator [Desulfopila sp.]|nr:TetR/AcrR family transcriptional regulator [Desulfopila sp.]
MVRTVKDPAERRGDIIAAACRLFLEKGYDKSTMADVMKELHIAKGTIYHYFNSKEELLIAVIDHMSEEQLAVQLAILENSAGNALERFEQFIIAGSRQQDHETVIEHLHKPANAGMHMLLLARHITVQAPLYAGLIEQGCREDLFVTDRPLERAEFILAGIQFLTDTGIYPWKEAELQRRIEAFPPMVESLLGASPSSFAFLLKVFK